MEDDNLFSLQTKSQEEYSQLGLGQRFSTKEIERQRDEMKESWAHIMSQNSIEKKII